ncbi:N-acetylmuramoyl-L-alanine amidase family protein [Flavobacterium sp. SM2513]|uniref:N-acetylmuramoyl-L-alanine amidase family protein n=1 Tax=Flavobacterium sp. SM2513 TaxID=3424766 RepID=UPI003D7F6591
MKNTFKFILAFVVVACFAFITPTDNGSKKTINVVIDAGHGGHDDGMTVDGITEKDIVASIAKKIKENNSDKNVVIHLTRTDDRFLSLKDRAKFINDLKPNLVLSLHVNGNENTEASGVELYISPKNVMYENSKKIAEDLNFRFVTNHNLKSRGVKDANFTLLRDTAYPTITVELGFLSNENDRKYLTDDNQQEKIAVTILELISAL